jgi:heptosyltransferase II
MDKNKPIDKTKIRRVLMRATNWVGDMVISLPAIDAVRELFPDSEITMLARPWVIPLIENNPSIDKIIVFTKGKGIVSQLSEFIKTVNELRKQKFDLAILFQNAFEAALLTYLSRIEYRIGYKTDLRGFLLTHHIERDKSLKNLHQVEYYLSILRQMGWGGVTKSPRLYSGKEEEEFADSFLQDQGVGSGDLLIGLSPGAIYGPAKRWPAERFAEVGDRAVEEWSAKVFILGSDSEKQICETTADRMKNQAINLCGKTTLGQAIALIKRADFFITNDSGLMHVAAALEVPMIAIFGSTDHIATGPLTNRVKVVRKAVECSPCLKPECPTDFKCMLSIEPEDVWNELKRLKEEL